MEDKSASLQAAAAAAAVRPVSYVGPAAHLFSVTFFFLRSAAVAALTG